MQELLNFQHCMKLSPFNAWVRYFMWNFKGNLWNSTQNIFPIHWKILFLYNIYILRVLRFKSPYVFSKHPLEMGSDILWGVCFVTVGSILGHHMVTFLHVFNTLRPRQDGRHFADDIFKRIFFNENVWISIKISLKFAPKGPINNIPALVQIMAWRRPGDKPLSEPMMVSLTTHVCVTRPQWVNYANLRSLRYG